MVNTQENLEGNPYCSVFLDKKRLIREKSVTFLNIIAICSGITVNIPLPTFKYLFLITAFIAISYSIAFIFCNKTGYINRGNFLYLSIGIYLFLLITGKRILSLAFVTENISIITGFGEVIYVLFGFFFFSMCELKKIKLFMIAYAATFTGYFLLFGQNTLYDIGNVCRTVGAYGNPNTLALYGGVSLCFSLYLLNMADKRKYIYALMAGISLAGVINSASRSMYLGILISLFCVGTYFILFQKRRHSFLLNRRSLLLAAFFLITAIAISFAYYPRSENAVINYVDKGNADKGNAEKARQKSSAREEAVTVIDRMVGKKEETETSSFEGNKRFEIWNEYFNKTDDYLLLGADIDSGSLYFSESWRTYDPHNSFIYFLYKYGILGLALFILLLIQVFTLTLSKGRLLKQQYILLFGLCIVLFHGMFHDAVKTGIFWCVLGLTYRYGIRNNRRYKSAEHV